ncbi:MAG: hypothetical protein F6K19_10575, partial [Cyanothece sp. SIO1E1]|nr:hypothetical protein [Cyanothece sp. SIO1E1]
MVPEQQQRIMGYFIEEAKDHLSTIEQGLLNLQGTIEDAEMVNEVFRAAHSVKGGAAMLGIDSIQSTAHRLEDYFKLLKEHPVKVERKTESLLLQVFDTLQELVYQLQGPFGLTQDKADEVMLAVGPVFQELNTHINALVQQSASGLVETESPVTSPVVASTPMTAALERSDYVESSALQLVFGSDVPAQLRDMLQLFKQVDQTDTRQQLQEICHRLAQAGAQFELSAWSALIATARLAIANPDNGYRTLAPVVIKDIKRAQDLVLAGREAEVSPSEGLLDMIPPAPFDQPLEEPSGDVGLGTAEFSDLFTTVPEVGTDDSNLTDFDLAAAMDANPEDLAAEMVDALGAEFGTDEFGTDEFDAGEFDAEVDAFALSANGLDTSMPPNAHSDRPGPEVGTEEMNSLADLFEGEEADLGLTWQAEETVENNASQLDAAIDTVSSGDFSDLLFEDTPSDNSGSALDAMDDLEDLFEDTPAEEQALADLFDDVSPAGSHSEDLQNAFVTPADNGDMPEELVSPEAEFSDLDSNVTNLLDDLDLGHELPTSAVEDGGAGNEVDEAIPELPMEALTLEDVDLDLFGQTVDLTEAESTDVEELMSDDTSLDLDDIDLFADATEAAESVSAEAVDTDIWSDDADSGAGLSLHSDTESSQSNSDNAAAGQPFAEPPPPLADPWETFEDFSSSDPQSQSSLEQELDEDLFEAFPDDTSLTAEPPTIANSDFSDLDLEDPNTDAAASGGSNPDLTLDEVELSTQDPAVEDEGLFEAVDPRLETSIDGLDGCQPILNENEDEGLEALFGEELIETPPPLESDPLELVLDEAEPISLESDLGEMSLDSGLLLGLAAADDVPEAEAELGFGLDAAFDDLAADLDLSGITDPLALEEADSAADDSSQVPAPDASTLELLPEIEAVNGAEDIGELPELSDLDVELGETLDSLSLEMEELSDSEALPLAEPAEDVLDLDAEFDNLSEQLAPEVDLLGLEDLSSAETTEDLLDLDAELGNPLEQPSPEADLLGLEDLSSAEATEDLLDLDAELGNPLEQPSPEVDLLGLEDLSLGETTEEGWLDLETDLGITPEQPSPEVDLLGLEDSPATATIDDDLLDLEADLGVNLDSPPTDADIFGLEVSLDDLNAAAPPEDGVVGATDLDDGSSDAIANTDFADLEDLLTSDSEMPLTDETLVQSEQLPEIELESDLSGEEFADLDALLEAELPAESLSAASLEPTLGLQSSTLDKDAGDASELDSFADLEKLLENADKTLGGSPTTKGVRGASPTSTRRGIRRGGSAFGNQTMRVAVRNLDNLNNLVGEL